MGFIGIGTPPTVGLGQEVRAFPNAEGVGALTRGAAGYSGAKSVAIVSTLADDPTTPPAGSLRAAIEGSGKEGTFVVFTVSGVIVLTDLLTITSSYITICGQTSPGGICLAGSPLCIGENNSGNSQVIVRHIRSRCGSDYQVGDPAESDGEAMRVWHCSDVMIDHCSLSWGVDETMSITTWNGAPAVERVTVSNCIISQGLTAPHSEADHGYGLLIDCDHVAGNSIDVHHTYFCHHNNRNPMVLCIGYSACVNNVVYDWQYMFGAIILPGSTGSGRQFNYIGNYHKEGVNSYAPLEDVGANGSTELQAQGGGIDDAVSGTPYAAIYMNNNYGLNRDNDIDDEWQIQDGWGSDNILSTDWKSSTAFTTSEGVAITATTLTAATAESVATTILNQVGATKPSRDSHDTEMVNDFINGTGTLKADVTYPTDWPTYSTPAAPTDSNNDGIPDDWTTANMGGASWSDVAGGQWGDYLWIEAYVNELAGDYD